MGYAMISGIGSKTFCLAATVTLEALRQTIDCSSKRFSFDFGPGSLGAISLGVLAIGRSSINASIDGRKAGFLSVFSRLWRVIPTTST